MLQQNDRISVSGYSKSFKAEDNSIIMRGCVAMSDALLVIQTPVDRRFSNHTEMERRVNRSAVTSMKATTLFDPTVKMPSTTGRLDAVVHSAEEFSKLFTNYCVKKFYIGVVQQVRRWFIDRHNMEPEEMDRGDEDGTTEVRAASRWGATFIVFYDD